MKCLLVLMEAFIIALLALFCLWIFEVRKANFRLWGVTDVVVKGGKQKEMTNAADLLFQKKLDLHMVIYMAVFVILLPHVLIVSALFDFLNRNCITCITFVLKLISFSLFFGGLVDVQSMAGAMDKVAMDFKTHHSFSRGAVIVFVVYLVITGVKFVGHMFHQIFQIQILGSLLRVVVSDWFVDNVDHLTNGAGFITMLTGLIAYLFLEKKGLDQSRLDESEDKERSDENAYLQAICILLSVLYFTILLAIFQKHYINNHTRFITVGTFREVFFPFRRLYAEEDIMGQEMPKVTSAQQMI